MRRTVKGILTGLRERVTERLARIDRPGIPRAAFRADGVRERIVVGPRDRGAGGDLDSIGPEPARLHFHRRPSTAPRRRLTSRRPTCRRLLPEVPAQRERNRELEAAP